MYLKEKKKKASAHRKENDRARTRGLAGGEILLFPQFASSKQGFVLGVCACCMKRMLHIP